MYQQPIYTNNPFSPPFQQLQAKCTNRLINNTCIVDKFRHPAYPSQRFSLIYQFNLDDDIEPLFKQPSEGPSQLVEDDYPVEEVAPVKRKYLRRHQSGKKNDKDLSEPWIPQEEVVLCRAWVDVSENSVDENAKKAAWFWTEVITYFQKEMREAKRSYDTVICKWKNMILSNVSQFCAMPIS
ncbi:hypothetical protein Tco_0981398 [Tanacetum coccineum]